MKALDLFSGIGGFSLGLERAGMQTVAFCEIEPFCQKVLKKHWPDVPIYEDIRSLDGKQFRGTVDVVCGGFPCQPFSVAGKRAGSEDDRHLWPEMLRVISESKPTWVIGENVGGFVDMAFDNCATDLENEGYSVTAFIIPACAVNAPHRRDRVWIIAYSSDKRCDSRSDNREERHLQEEQIRNSKEDKPKRHGRKPRISEDATVIADIDHVGRKGSKCKTLQGKSTRERQLEGSDSHWANGWPVSSPRVCGVHDGVSDRTHRLKALGNAVVPQIPEIIGKAIMQIKTQQE